MAVIIEYLPVLVTMLVGFDIINIFRNKRQIKDFKYQLHTGRTLSAAVILVLSLTIACYLAYTHFVLRKPALLSNAYIFLLLSIQLGFHLSNKSYICDIGIFYWGGIYKWSDLQSYSWDEKGRYITFKVIKRAFNLTDDIKFRIEEGLKDEVDGYLRIHVK